MERFLKEYAIYQKSTFVDNELMIPEIKKRAVDTIDRALKARERGFITVDETIRMILNPFD